MNAYTVARDDGIMLVDCGTAGDATCALALEQALDAAGHDVRDVRALVITHAHSDHVGLAAWVRRRSGCEVWMHRDVAHFFDAIRRPRETAAARRLRARAEGVPEEKLPTFADLREEREGACGPVEATGELRDGTVLPSALGEWEVIATPGHAPSHVCLLQRERGLAIVGDTVCATFVPWFDYGYSPDPIAEFLQSLELLDKLVPVRLALPGHGRPIDDLAPILADHRAGVASRLAAVRRAVEEIDDAIGAYALSREVFGEQTSDIHAVERTVETAAYLRHLRLIGEIGRVRTADGRFRYESLVAGI